MEDVVVGVTSQSEVRRHVGMRVMIVSYYSVHDSSFHDFMICAGVCMCAGDGGNEYMWLVRPTIDRSMN